MNRNQFLELRNLPGKTIASDIEFIPHKFSTSSLIFEQVEVSNSLGYELILNGSFVPAIPAIKFNFSIKSAGGSICRIEINGKLHREAGRTHKHDLRTENCPRKNLPFADARSDLDLSKQSASEIWAIICKEANIIHTGVFKDPSRRS
jgi:hypothetical protein